MAGKLTGHQYLDSRGVMDRYHISDSTLLRWQRVDQLAFPKPFKINRRSYWRVTDLDAWDTAKGANDADKPAEALGLPIVSELIQSYDDFVKAMRQRREALKLPAIEADAYGGLQEGYTNKLENWPNDYGRGMGPEVFPLWLRGMRVGIILVDLPRRPHMRRNGKCAKAVRWPELVPAPTSKRSLQRARSIATQECRPESGSSNPGSGHVRDQ